MSRNTSISVAAGFVAVAALAIAGYNVRQISEQAKLREHHSTTPGTITSRSVGAHGTGEYEFSVDGKEFDARDVGGAQRQFGDKVTVYYFPEHPSLSSLHDPLIWQSTGWPAVAILLFICCLSICFAAGWLPLTG